jgi:hypothetical protein
MGLSDEERISKVFAVFIRLNDYFDTNTSQYHKYDLEIYNKLKKIVKKLWITYYSGSRNGMFWFCGGEIDSTDLPPMGTMASSFRLLDKEDVFFPPPKDEEEKKDRDFWNYEKPEKEQTSYDKLCYYIRQYFDKIEFLHKKNEHAVWNVFRECEAYFYAANRYDDKLSKRLGKVTKLFAEMMGICTHAFANNPVYYKAWMADKILEKFKVYDGNDLVMQWFIKHNFHHKISLKYYDNAQLYADYKKFRALSAPSLMDKIEVLFRFIGGGLDDFYHKQLLESCKKANFSEGDIKKVEGWLNNCKKLREEKEAETKTDYNKNRFDSVWFESYDVKDTEEKPEVKKEVKKISAPKKKPVTKKAKVKK